MNKFYSLLLALSWFFVSCQKDWLEIRRDKKQVIPATSQDLQAILDNSSVMNQLTPWLIENSADDLYLLSDRWETISYAPNRNAYIWAKDIYEGNDDADWENCYERIFYANTVLEEVDRVSDSVDPAIKGSALFYRAWNFYILAQLFCKPYMASSAKIDLGIPVRTQADINIPVVRNTVSETYAQIVDDLMTAIGLLPPSVVVPTRPSRSAAYALLAKAYLQMSDFTSALDFADSCLHYKSDLLDYNDLDLSANYPLKRFNQEVLFHSTISTASPFLASRLNTDSLLFRSYHKNDIRKLAFFVNEDGTGGFRGSYNESSVFFTGITTAEIMLTRAECNARLGRDDLALIDLETILRNRYIGNEAPEIRFESDNELLGIILAERRKELVFRGIRWADLRRLNLESALSRSIYRNINGNLVELRANDPRYTLPIPDKVIRLSGIKQNDR